MKIVHLFFAVATLAAVSAIALAGPRTDAGLYIQDGQAAVH